MHWRCWKDKEQKTRENLYKIIQKENLVLPHIEWFSNLEKPLKQNYSINIREDIQSFLDLIKNFKQIRYDAEDILQEYLRSQSLIRNNKERKKNTRVSNPNRAIDKPSFSFAIRNKSARIIPLVFILILKLWVLEEKS
jgi:hypothetical protein